MVVSDVSTVPCQQLMAITCPQYFGLQEKAPKAATVPNATEWFVLEVIDISQFDVFLFEIDSIDLKIL